MEMGDEALEQFLYVRTNPKGRYSERWRHIHGCARFFNVVRNTVSDRIEASYKVGEPCPAVQADALA